MTTSLYTPKYDVCGFCRKRQHKVAVYYENGYQSHWNDHPTQGFCPKCWEYEFVQERAQQEGRVVYDRRKK